MIKVHFRGIGNSDPRQQDIARRACAALEQALNHPEFAERVGRAQYRETRFRDQYGTSFSVPPAEVYGYIAAGAERGTAADATIEIEVMLEDRQDVGGTYPGQLPFYTAFWFINGCIDQDDPISLASHFIHEWLHVAGFHHYPTNNARQDVPYVVQEIVGDILKASALAAASPPPGVTLFSLGAAPPGPVLAPMEAKLLAAGCGAHDGPGTHVATLARPSDGLLM